MNMNLREVIIETERLRLLPISSKYRQDIFNEFTEPVARFTFPQPTGDIADTDMFISGSTEKMEQGEELQFVVIHRGSEEFIGCTGLHALLARPEPGIWLKESAWNKGFGYEIVAALKSWADEHLDYTYLYYPVARENFASRRIPEKLGGKVEKREFESRNARGESHMSVAYRIYR